VLGTVAPAPNNSTLVITPDMLSSFRYISIISFLLVLLAAFFAGEYFQRLAVQTLIEAPLVNDSRKAADHYFTRVWCPYSGLLGNLAETPVETIRNTSQFNRFSKTSDLILDTLPASKISLYAKHDRPFFSTHSRDVVFFEDTGPDGNLFREAMSDGLSSRVIRSAGQYDINGDIQKGTLVQVNVRMSGSLCTTPVKPNDIVIEFFYERSNSIENLTLFQFAVTGGIITTFLILYLALFVTSRRAERIINKQHDENLSLADAKARAEMQNKEKSMFLANVSHELRTPLNAIIGFSEIIRDEVMGPIGNQQYKEYISDINTSGVHLLSLINDILDYSKAEAKKLEVDCTDVDLSKIAHGCMRLVEPRAREAKVKLIEQVSQKAVIVQADPKRMKQVILNLLSNAVKFTPENGEVLLAIHEDIVSERVEIIVRDTGIGIAQKDISKALAPFGQVDSGISRPGGRRISSRH
jgi:two-component system cell cycle sensor histidine kinase PleC